MAVSARISQILEVLGWIHRSHPFDLERLPVVRKAATRGVSTTLGITERTVEDKCTRGLGFPHGSPLNFFDDLVTDWLFSNDNALRVRLESRVVYRADDLAAIAAFFDGATPPPTKHNGAAIVDHVAASLQAEGLTFSRTQLADFYLCVRTKPFVLLAGISGTGKSLLARRFADACGFGATMIPVRPDWSDPGDLLGYRDLQERFAPGRLVEALLAASEAPDRPHFAILDEMNLARVEHYFAEVLSVMETRRRDLETGWIQTETPLLSLDPGAPIAATPAAAQRLHDALDDGRLYVPENLTFIGTVNMDESTHPFSRKVLDRAMTMEFNEVALDLPGAVSTPPAPISVDASELASDLLSPAEIPDEQRSRLGPAVDVLKRTNEELKACSMQVGFRVRDEVCVYLHHNAEQSLLEPKVALDLALHHKVLPRIQGGEEVGPVLLGVRSICEREEATRCAEKLDEMQRRLRDVGYTSFWS